MTPIVAKHLDEIRELCDRYGVRRLDLFGSATTDRFDPATSDLDFLVDFADRSPGYADRYMAVAEGLEAILGRCVDLVTERSVVSPDFRTAVEQQRRMVYDRGVDAWVGSRQLRSGRNVFRVGGTRVVAVSSG